MRPSLHPILPARFAIALVIDLPASVSHPCLPAPEPPPTPPPPRPARLHPRNRRFGPRATCYKFVAWCNNYRELFDLALDPDELTNM